MARRDPSRLLGQALQILTLILQHPPAAVHVESGVHPPAQHLGTLRRQQVLFDQKRDHPRPEQLLQGLEGQEILVFTVIAPAAGEALFQFAALRLRSGTSSVHELVHDLGDDPPSPRLRRGKSAAGTRSGAGSAPRRWLETCQNALTGISRAARPWAVWHGILVQPCHPVYIRGCVI